MVSDKIKLKDVLFYTRIIPNVGIYDLLEIKVRTIEDNWFVGIEKRDKHAYLFPEKAINNYIFKDRNEALKKIKEAESKKKTISEETYYEEY